VGIFNKEARTSMHGPLLGEFMGTMVLILLGDGVVANVLLKKSKAENSGWIVIATGWGLAVVAGIFTAIAFGSPGANINPPSRWRLPYCQAIGRTVGPSG
jgi:glycerol uptake facilitator-like aquaporin